MDAGPSTHRCAGLPSLGNRESKREGERERQKKERERLWPFGRLWAGGKFQKKKEKKRQKKRQRSFKIRVITIVVVKVVISSLSVYMCERRRKTKKRK